MLNFQICKKIIIDFYRYHVNRIQIKSIHDISIWRIPYLNIYEREKKFNLINEWLDKNKDIINYNNIKGEPVFTNFKEKRLDEIDKSFNVNKHVPFQKTKKKSKRKIISLREYSLLSNMFIEEYEKTLNVRYLNSALKVNDFLFFCQIKSSNNILSGSIPEFFPSYYNYFNITYETNILFKKAVEKELKIVTKLRDEAL